MLFRVSSARTISETIRCSICKTTP
ncbi:MAG TPA: hypothetical protein DCO72_10280 [Ruminococcus sp.]|nr:hypothetical protein [Ruminococcus sp.]